MSRFMKKKPILILLAFSFLVATVILALWTWSLNKELDERLSQEWFAPPVEFYYGAIKLTPSQLPSHDDLRSQLINLGYRERDPSEPLQKKDFYSIPPFQCNEELESLETASASECLRLRSSMGTLYTIVWKSPSPLLLQGDGLSPVDSVSLEPQLIGELQGGQPLKKKKVKLPEVPLLCLQAVTAIEDNDFLKHRGVSPSGIMRAIIRNLLAGRFAQGGSTITQQLVKNYFLTHEKTIKRKVTEQIIAILLETKLNKDQILEKYLNVIYMGQEGPYQVIGLSSAANHYLGKKLSELNLSECALLAALINNPGRYNPFRHPDRAKQRRSLVLEKMTELGWIQTEEQLTSNQFPLPDMEKQDNEPSAPYFLELAYQELLDLKLPEGRGFKVLTSLSPNEQLAMEEGVKKQLPFVQKRSKSDSPIEVAAIRVHLPSHQVTSLIGGSHFRKAPYNRALRSQRQIGSIIKPFIYWQAFTTHRPWDQISNTPFTWKFDNKEWTPRNYDRTHSDQVYLYEALVKSLNIPAARLAQEVGLDSLRDTLFSAGFNRDIAKLPSMALGALEMTPLEVAQLYSTIGNMGRHKKISSLISVEDFDGQRLYTSSAEEGEQRLDPNVTATLISTLQLSPTIGTAQGLKYFINTENVAGKTGTTNDLKDSWFVGLTPTSLMVVWIGRDDNNATGLTGASGALPLWGAIQKRIDSPTTNFQWPESTDTESFNSYEFRVGPQVFE